MRIFRFLVPNQVLTAIELGLDPDESVTSSRQSTVDSCGWVGELWAVDRSILTAPAQTWTPTPFDQAGFIFVDDFESGTTSSWSAVAPQGLA